MDTKLRNYCFTSNKLPEINIDSQNVKYYIYQREIGKKTNHEHWQGYIELKKPMRYKAVKELFNDDTLHLEARRGTREEAINYCKKKETKADKFEDPTEWGDILSGQGKRSDLQEIGTQILEGATKEEIANNYPGMYIKYNKGIAELQHATEKVDEWRNVKVYVLWGNSGVGKTKKAVEKAKGGYFKLNTNTNGALWFDGYRGEKTLILDDFYGWIKWGELLTLLDGYKYRCQIKGGHVWAKWKYVIITSNEEPERWYSGRSDLTPLLRRISKIIHM